MDHLELHLHEPPDSADAEADALTEDSDLRWLLGDPRGRRVARRLLTRSRLFQSTFTGEAVGSAFREGVRDAGLGFLAKLMRADPVVTARILAGQEGR